MAIQYLVVCVFDFILAPVFWTSLQAYLHLPVTQWVPTTLGSGGTYHLAMGAVLGVAAWTRSLEKSDEKIRTAYDRGAYDRESGYYQNSAYRKQPLEPQGKRPLPGME